MSKSKEDRARAVGIPTSKETHERKGTTVSKDWSRASRALLYGGLGFLFFMLGLILTGFIPPQVALPLEGFLLDRLFLEIFTGSAALVVAILVLVLVRQSRREKSAKRTPPQRAETPQTQAPPPTARESASSPVSERLERNPKRDVVVCICGLTLDAETSIWVDYAAHLRDHYGELREMFGVVPDLDLLKKLVDLYFHEA